MRIGIFGGSFDPVHRGHLTVARAARDQLALDEVRFVPAREQPFKIGSHAAGPADRLAMLEAALADEPGFVADACELDRPGPSYTVDTLRHFARVFPSDQLFFLVGADAARDLPSWREAEALPALATVVVLTRPGAVVPSHPLLAERLTVPAVDVTASAVRDRRARGEPVDDLVPEAVRAVMTARRLYERT